MLNALFAQKKSFFNPNLKTLNTYRLVSLELHLAQFFSLESLTIFSAYAKTSLGLKMEKFLQTILNLNLFSPKLEHLESHQRETIIVSVISPSMSHKYLQTVLLLQNPSNIFFLIFGCSLTLAPPPRPL